MRFKITFHRTGRQRMLPMDYQYYLSAWIYKVIGQADHEFANFLHSEGYTDGNRRFKLFNYSQLDFGKPILWKEKALFEIHADKIFLQTSFHLNDTAEKFIIGLFNNQQVYIGDQFNGIDLTVGQIERLSDNALIGTVHYRAVSPVVISILNEGDKYAQYLSPDHVEYAGLLKRHLRHKHHTTPGSVPLPEDFDFHFSLKSATRSKLITIKPYTPLQSKVRGFMYDFSMKAPVEIHQMVWSCGIGEKNSTGFGWVERRDFNPS